MLPATLFYFYRYQIPLLGLLLGNLVDLDHVFYRIIGKVGWFQSACPHFGMQCSFGFYPLHNWTVTILCLALGFFIFAKNKKLKFVGWISLGVLLNFLLDYIQLITGFGI
jgi:hypothetical protein